MLCNRRSFLVSAPALATVLPAMQATPEASDVSSGGLGLSYEEVKTLYEELPAGEGYRGFIEPDTKTSLFFDFGDNDFARTIWVHGSIQFDAMTRLLTMLTPSDALLQTQFGMSEYAGSMAHLRIDVWHSPSMKIKVGGDANFVAKYTVLPGEPEWVRNLVIGLGGSDE